jgi:hypothetical protein
MVISLNSFLFHQIYLSLLVNIPSSKSLNTSLVARYTFAHVITGSNNLRYLWFQCPWYISVTLSKPKRKSSLGLELAIHFAHLVKLNKLPIRSFDSRQLSPACLGRKGDWLSHIKDGLSKVFERISGRYRPPLFFHQSTPICCLYLYFDGRFLHLSGKLDFQCV